MAIRAAMSMQATPMLTLQSTSMFLENTPITLVIGGVIWMSLSLDNRAPLAGLVLGDEHDIVRDVLEGM